MNELYFLPAIGKSKLRSLAAPLIASPNFLSLANLAWPSFVSSHHRNPSKLQPASAAQVPVPHISNTTTTSRRAANSRDIPPPRCLNVSHPLPRNSFPQKAHLANPKPPQSPVFCDYCDVYLTHDSMSVRKAHNSGRNHLRNVVDYYQRTSSTTRRTRRTPQQPLLTHSFLLPPFSEIGHEKAQSVIDSITSSYAAEGQAHANPMLPHNQPGGGGFGLGPGAGPMGMGGGGPGGGPGGPGGGPGGMGMPPPLPGMPPIPGMMPPFPAGMPPPPFPIPGMPGLPPGMPPPPFGAGGAPGGGAGAGGGSGGAPAFPFPPPFPPPPGGPGAPAGSGAPPPFPMPGAGGAPPPFPPVGFPPPGAGGLPFPPPPGAGGGFPAFPPPPGGFPGEKR